MPDISVVMPLYNTRTYIAEAVNSILQDKDVDFEMVIIDDCSTDGSSDIVAEIARADNRVHHIRLEKNGGMAAGLNRGVAEARAPLITQMDSDDVSLPGRLAAQVAFMRANPSVDYAGASVQYINSQGNFLTKEINGEILTFGQTTTICDSDLLAWKVPFGNQYANPTMVMRTQILRDNPYSTEELFRYCVDYEFWCRLNWKYRGANMPEKLLHYRMHQEQGSRIFNASQNLAAIEVARRAWSELAHKEMNAEDIVKLHDLSQSSNQLSVPEFEHLADILTGLLIAFMRWKTIGGQVKMSDKVLPDYVWRMHRLASGTHLPEDQIGALLGKQQVLANQAIQGFLQSCAA